MEELDAFVEDIEEDDFGGQLGTFLFGHFEGFWGRIQFPLFNIRQNQKNIEYKVIQQFYIS